MAGGVAFDPAEFAAYKAGLPTSPGGDRDPPAAGAADGFDPAEFAAFKAARGRSASFEDRFSAAPPMSRGQAAPKAAGGDGQSIAGDQAAADKLFAGMRARADEDLIGKPSRLNDATAALFGAGQAGSLNLAGRAAAGAATGLGWLQGKGFPGISGYGDGSRTYDENYDRFRDLRDAYGRQSPKSTLAGTVAGAVGTAPLLPGLAGAPAGNIALRAGQYGVSGGIYGAGAEAIDSGDPMKAAIAGGTGFGAGAILGPVVEKVAPPVVAAAGKALAPILDRFGSRAVVAAEGGFTPEARAALRAAGLDADNLPPELAQHVEATFAAKGPSAAAAREAQAAEQGITLSRGQATQDPRTLAREGAALGGARGERAQAVARGFADQQAAEIAAGGDRLQGMAAGTSDRVPNAQAAYEAAAERARQVVQDQAGQASTAQRGLDDALRVVRGRGGTDAIDGAEAAIQGVRDAAETARGAYRGAYADVGQIPGTFAPGAMDRVGSRVRVRLGSEVPIDDVLTPAATRAIRDLDNVPGLFDLKPGEGPDLQQVEQLRRRLIAYRGTTGQNATDRRAVDRILSEFDGHVEDAMGAGLFGQGAARGPGPAGDGFPGMASAPAAPTAIPAAGSPPARAGEPETLTRYLARGGGIPNDAEAKAADLHRLYVPGQGTLARNDAPSWDQIRVRLAEEGFLPPGMDGAASARDVADWARQAIHTERTGGRPAVRMGDEPRVGGQRAADTLADQNAAYAERMAPFRQQVVDDLAAAGVSPRHVEAGHLDDAAERLFRGEHASGADAYEAAVLARGADYAGRTVDALHEVPFDGPTAPAASSAMPGGDTAPLAAMQRARGLFRDYKQAFAPRGPGDVAGQRLQRIVQADASPNEVAAMLFGSPGTGKVTAGQVQTLARLREAVGSDSSAWRATQQALIARHLGGERRDLLPRLRYLVRGEGRGLMNFLSPEMRSSLGQLELAARQAENAGLPAPTWASDLERSGFDPNRVAHGLFGGSEMGARVGAAAEARAAKAFLGEDSAEWSGLRQAAIQRLMASGDGPGGAGRTAAQALSFVDGSGKGVSQALFTDAERAQIRRFGAALHTVLTPEGAVKPDAGARLDAVKIAFDRLAHMVAFHVGGFAGLGVSVGAKAAREAAVARGRAYTTRRSFEGGAPVMTLPPTDYAVAAGRTTGRVLAPLGGRAMGY